MRTTFFALRSSRRTAVLKMKIALCVFYYYYYILLIYYLYVVITIYYCFNNIC